MKLRWTKAELAYFTKPIPTAERDYSWVGWLILTIASLAGLGYFIWQVI